MRNWYSPQPSSCCCCCNKFSCKHGVVYCRCCSWLQSTVIIFSRKIGSLTALQGELINWTWQHHQHEKKPHSGDTNWCLLTNSSFRHACKAGWLFTCHCCRGCREASPWSSSWDPSWVGHPRCQSGRKKCHHLIHGDQATCPSTWSWGLPS